MSTHTHRPSFTLLPVLALAAIAGGCSPSGSDSSQNPGQPGGGSVPARFALFVSDLAVASEREITLVDLETDATRTVSAQVPAGHRIRRFGSRLSPDGRHVGITTEEAGFATFRVLSVADGSMVTLPFSSTESAGEGDGGPPAAEYRFSPDGSRLLVSFRDQSTSAVRTFVMDADGESRTELAPGQASVQARAWLPDSSAFVAILVDPVDFNSRVVLVDAASLDRTALGPVLGSSMDIDRVELSRDGTALAYAVEYEVGTTYLYAVVGVDLGTGAASVFDAIPSEPEADLLAITDDGSAVAFVTEQLGSIPQLLWLGDIRTGVLNVLNGPLVNLNAEVLDLAWEPGGTRLAYLANHRDLDVDELFLASVQASGTPVEASLIPDSDVESFAWSPAGGLLAFTFDPSGSISDQVYLLDANAATPPLLVTGGPNGQGADELLWAPDGAWLYVREQRPGAGTHVLAFRSDDVTQPQDLGAGWEGFAAGSFDGPVFTRLVPHAGMGGVAEAVWVRRGGATNQRELVFGSPADPAATRRISPLPGPGGGDEFNEIFVR